MSFVIEVYWPGMSPALVDGLVSRVIAVMEDSGVRYRGCTMAPTDEVCFVRVQAADEATVRALIARLGIEGARISETIDLPIPGRGST